MHVNRLAPVMFAASQPGVRTHQASPLPAASRAAFASTAPLPQQRQSVPRFGTLAYLPQVRFGSVLPAGFDQAAIETIQQVLSQCHYGKNTDSLLQAGFKAHMAPNGVILENYSPSPGNNGKIQGVCEDLAEEAGRQIKQQLGDKYVVVRGVGQCSNYFYYPQMTHVFLLAWPASEDKRIWEELEYRSGFFPEGCLIIDPSFGLIGKPVQGKTSVSPRLPQGTAIQPLSTTSGKSGVDSHDPITYRLQEYHLLPVKHQNTPATAGFCIDRTGDVIPLGYLRDLAPEAATGPKDPTLVWIRFMQPEPNKPSTISLVVQESPCAPLKRAPELLAQLQPHQQLAQLIARIQTGFTSPASQQAKDLKRVTFRLSYRQYREMFDQNMNA